MRLGFRIHFLATRTTFCLAHTISLQKCKNYTIHYTTFILALNDAEDILFSQNIVVVHVSFICVLSNSNQRYRQLADRCQSLDSNNRSHISNAIQRKEFVVCFFDSFWTTLHKYVPYRSVRWRCITLCTQTQNLWGNLCNWNHVKPGTHLSMHRSAQHRLVRCESWCNINGKKAVHTEHAQNNAHLERPTTIGSGPHITRECSKHMPQVICAVHTGAPRQFGAVQCAADLYVLKCVLGLMSFRLAKDYSKFSKIVFLWNFNLKNIMFQNFSLKSSQPWIQRKNTRKKNF